MTVVRVRKESGFFWLGDVPSIWQVVRGKDLFRKMSLQVRDEDEVVTCFRDGTTTLRRNRREDGFTFAQKEIGYQGVRAGHLVIHAMDSFAGAIGISDSDGKCSPVYSVCGAKYHAVTHLPYFSWVLRDMSASGYIQSVAKGIRERSTDFRYSEVEDAHFSLPPLNEQCRIAAWLDLQTSRIDKRRELLGKKREPLRDLRSNLISETLASGLRGQEKVPTGLSDIPELPLGWEASHAKRLLRFVTRGSRGWVEYYADEGDFFLRIGNLPRETIELDLSDVQHVALPSKAAEGKRTRILESDMLVSITADLGSIAVAQKLAKPAYVNQHIALCRPKDSVHPRWLGYAMLSSQSKRQMMSSGYGGTKVQLSLDDVRNVWLAVPPLDEQQEIAAFLDRKLSQIDRQIALIDQLDDLLKQQRKAIIHEAVTGKIDLSGAPVGDKLSPTEVVRPPSMREEF